MFIKFCHKALAEYHYLVIGFAFRIKIRAAFAAADRQPGQRVFKCLFKSKEFKDALVNRRMKAEASFVRPDCIIKLQAVALVNTCTAFVVHPGNTEVDNSFRFYETLQKSRLSVLCFVGVNYQLQRIQYLFHCLMEFFFTRIFPHCFVVDFFDIRHRFFLLTCNLALHFRPPSTPC